MPARVKVEDLVIIGGRFADESYYVHIVGDVAKIIHVSDPFTSLLPYKVRILTGKHKGSAFHIRAIDALPYSSDTNESFAFLLEEEGY